MLSRSSGSGGDRDDKDWTDADRDNADGDNVNPHDGNGRPP
jgi:hypothetical protein